MDWLFTRLSFYRNYITAVAEEVKEPSKTLPRGLWISVPMVTLLYVTTNFAFFVLLDTEQMLETSAVAVVSLVSVILH